MPVLPRSWSGKLHHLRSLIEPEKKEEISNAFTANKDLTLLLDEVKRLQRRQERSEAALAHRAATPCQSDARVPRPHILR